MFENSGVFIFFFSVGGSSAASPSQESEKHRLENSVWNPLAFRCRGLMHDHHATGQCTAPIRPPLCVLLPFPFLFQGIQEKTQEQRIRMPRGKN